MNLYLDASALVKRYVAEPGSDVVRRAMAGADAWFMCRIGYAETLRAVGSVAGSAALAPVRADWGSIGAIEVDDRLAEEAAELALAHGLGTLDALHLAAAALLPPVALTVATWDRHLHAAASALEMRVLPEVI